MIIDRNLIPVLGPLKLSALTTKRIRAALDRLASGERLDRHGERAKPLGSATVAMCRSVLSNALADAVEDGLISSNPAAQLKRAATSTATPKDRALSDDELRALVAAALKYDRTRPDDEHSAVAPLAALLIMGLRISEALAVRWADVSLAHGVLTVSGNLYRERIPGDGRKDRTYGHPRILRGEPKTARSRRTIALPASILAILAEHHVRQNEHRARVGVWGGSDAVCASPIGTWTDDSAARKRLGLVGNSAGIDNLHPHLLRHSAASMAVQDGAPLAHVSGELGHSNISMTSDRCRPTDRIAWRDCPGR